MKAYIGRLMAGLGHPSLNHSLPFGMRSPLKIYGRLAEIALNHTFEGLMLLS